MPSKPKLLEPIPRSSWWQDNDLCHVYGALWELEHSTNALWVSKARMCRFTLATGMRVAEVAGVRFEDFQEGFFIHVCNGKGGKQRDVRCIPEYEPFWVRLLADPRTEECGVPWPTVGGTPPSRDTCQAWWGDVWYKTWRRSRRTLKRLSIHGARHTYASWELAMGRLSLEELSWNLGHASVETTRQYYLHSVMEFFYVEHCDRVPKWQRAALADHYLELDRPICRSCHVSVQKHYRFCPMCGEQLRRENGRPMRK